MIALKNISKLLLPLLLAGCTSFQKAEFTPELAAQIEASNKGKEPLQNFFKESEYQSVKISPDGKHLAVLFPKNGINALAVLTSDLGKVISRNQFENNLSIDSVNWVNNTRLVISASRKYGYLDGRSGFSQTYFVDYDGKAFDNFFQKEYASFDLLSTLPDDSKYVVMARYSWSERGRPVAVKVDTTTGRYTTVALPPIKRGSLIADYDGSVNVAIQNDLNDFDKSEIHYRLDKNEAWTKLNYPATSKSGTVAPLYLDKANKTLLVSSSHETGRDAIYKLDLTTGKTTLVSSDNKVDASGFIYEKGKLVGVYYQPDYLDIEVLDPDSLLMKIYRDLGAAFPGESITGVSLTQDQSEGVFRVSSDRNPGDVYHLEVKSMKVKKLGSSRTWVRPSEMAAMKPVTIKARDGLELPAYLTLPPKAEGKNLPAVLYVHGGPHGVRDDWGFDPSVQFLANRGYAVLQVNYRGSGGYGIPFLEAGYREWGRKMQDDLTDSTKWLVAQGYADPKRICIYGASYGGYAALMGAVREPDLYRCAITSAGVSDLTIQAKDSDTSDVAAGENYLKKVIGEDVEELKARSAVYNVDKIKIPIFIAAGMDDVRVPYSNATRLKEAMDKAGKKYEWMAKPSEGHGFQQPANRYEFYYRLEKFLNEHTAVSNK